MHERSLHFPAVFGFPSWPGVARSSLLTRSPAMVVSARLCATFGRGHRPGFHSPIILCDRILPLVAFSSARLGQACNGRGMPWAPLNRLHFRRATPPHSFGISKRTMSRLISSRKIAARKAGLRTLVDVASVKAYRIVATEIRSRAACVRPSNHGQASPAA